MAWSGTGTFSRIVTTVSPATGGTTIDSADMNTYTTDTASGINACLAKNGENAATGDISLGSNQLKAVADGTLATDAPNVGQIQDGSFVYEGTVGGTVDAITMTLTPPLTTYAAGQVFRFRATTGNCTGGGVTLNIDSLGAKTVVTNSIADPRAGDISTNGVYTVVYDGTRFLLQNPERETDGVFANNSNGNPNVSDTSYTVTGLAAGAWAEIGRTGAGNAWSALDNLPDDIDWIELKTRMDVTNTGATGAAGALYARKAGGGDDSIGTDNLICACTVDDGTSSNKSILSLQTHKIPVGTDNTFDVYYTETGSAIIAIYLIGYGWN